MAFRLTHMIHPAAVVRLGRPEGPKGYRIFKTPPRPVKTLEAEAEVQKIKASPHASFAENNLLQDLQYP